MGPKHCEFTEVFWGLTELVYQGLVHFERNLWGTTAVTDNKAELVPVDIPGNTARGAIALNTEHITLGRAASNTVVLHDPEVSKFHAEILAEGNSFVLWDLGSSNGTWVNGEAITNRELQPGDEIEFGASRYVFEPLRSEHSVVTIVPKNSPDNTQVVAITKVNALAPAREIAETAELGKMYDRVRAAFQAVQSLIETTDIRRLCRRILDVTFDIVLAETGAVLLFDDNHELVPWATRAPPKGCAADILISRTIIDQVLQEQSALLASDALYDSRWSSSESIITSGTRSLICVPLLNGDKIFGVLHIGNASQVAAFSTADLELVSGIGTGGGVAFQCLLAHQLAEEARTRQSRGVFFPRLG
ncbi:MAG: FHA domain-containing protein [Myxococcota bacterium]